MQIPKGITREDLRAWRNAFSLWFTKASRIAVVMARGAYWLGERKRLMMLLGSQTFERMTAGGTPPDASDPLVGQIQRISEKLEAEERLIQEIRANEKRMDE